MLIHQLICLPTPETIAYLKNVFDACPIEINWSETYVEINSSTEVQEADLERSYVAYAGTMDRFYDTATGAAQLILPLNSPDLEERAAEVRREAPSAFYADAYFPHLVIKAPMPTMRPHRRALINSYSTSLAAQQQPLIFDAELVVPKEYFQIPQLDYYTTMQSLKQHGGSMVRMANSNVV
jgi:hypothetical protein